MPDRTEWASNLEVHGEHVYEVGRLGFLAHSAADDCAHVADWILWGPRGGLIKYGDEICGVDAVIPKGWKLSFPDQSWFGHTEGKIIDGLSDVFKPGQTLIIEGRLPPCSQCQNIMRKASHEIGIAVQYLDEFGQSWLWSNGDKLF